MASTDDIETNTKFAQKNDADFPVLADPEKSAAKAYGVLGFAGFASRHTFYIGPDGRIVAIDKKVSAFNAGPDVVKKLGELGVPRSE